MGITLEVAQPVRSWLAWFRHFVEMVLAMFAGMAIFGTLGAAVFALTRSARPGSPVLQAFLMTVYMTLGMALWMRRRRHGWAHIGEMTAVMFVPLIVLIGPYATDVLAKGPFYVVLHVLMLPCMAAVMLLRRDEYSFVHAHEGGSR